MKDSGFSLSYDDIKAIINFIDQKRKSWFFQSDFFSSQCGISIGNWDSPSAMVIIINDITFTRPKDQIPIEAAEELGQVIKEIFVKNNMDKVYTTLNYIKGVVK